MLTTISIILNVVLILAVFFLWLYKRHLEEIIDDKDKELRVKQILKEDYDPK